MIGCETFIPDLHLLNLAVITNFSNQKLWASLGQYTLGSQAKHCFQTCLCI